MADVEYLIKVNAEGALTQIKQFEGGVDGLGKTSSDAGKKHGLFSKEIFGSVFIAQQATKAMHFLWGEIKSFPQAAMEAEKADKAMAAALEITGRPVEELSRHFKDFANEMQGSTIYEDEAVKGAQALLIQLTNLDKNGLDRATKGSIGLASVMGMDLESAASLVAKAMAGNESVLSRYGIQVDKTKSAEEQRAQILDKLEQFYGRATAETETYGGKLAQLKNKYGEVQEAVGGYITKNAALMDSLNGVADALLFQLQLGDRLASQEAEQRGQMDRYADSLAKVAVEAKMQYGAMGKLIEAYNGNTIALAKAISQGKHGKEAQEALNKVRREEIVIFDRQQKALNDATKGTNKYEGEIKDATKAGKKYVDILSDMPGAIKKIQNSYLQITPAMANVGEVASQMALDWSQSTVDIGLDLQRVAQEFQDKYGDILTATSDLFSNIGALIDANSQKKQAAIDKDYQAEKWAIEQSKLSEEDKQIALSKLEEEYTAKSEALRIQAAKKQKTIAYLSAVVDIAQGVTKALASSIPPWNIALAAITAAAGMVQIATIRATPLAKGAIFNQPTLLPGMNGSNYQVAEPGSGGVEIVATPENIRKAVGGGMGGNNRFSFHIYIDGKPLRQFIVRTIDEQSALGKLKVDGKVVA